MAGSIASRGSGTGVGFSLLVLAGCLLAPCRRPPAIDADVAVLIHGEEVRYGEFEAYLRDNVDGAGASLDNEVQSRLFDQFLDQQLLIRSAVERGLVEPDVEPREAIAFLLRGSPGGGQVGGSPGGGQVGGHPPTGWTEIQLAAYYDAHAADYQRPEEVHLRQILVSDRAVAVQARKAIASGEDFGQVAARFSQEPNAQLGGDQGRLAREDLPVAYVDAIFDLDPGEVSGIVAADYGFHIFQVVERYPARVAPLAEVVDTIRQALERRQVDEIVAGFIQEARERYNVVVFPSNVPFDYQGDYVHRDTATNAQ